MGRWPVFFAATVLVLSLGLTGMIANRGVPVVLATNLENLPMEIAGYQGREDSFPQTVYDVLQADLNVYRHYRSKAGDQLSLYIGYYGTAKGGRTGHNPYACLPGAGWGIIETGAVEIYPSYQPQGAMVNYVVAGKDGVNNVMLHWYQAAGTRVLATGLQQNIERFKGRVLDNRNDGAYVQVNAFAGETDVARMRERIRVFVGDVMELLPEYWPEEGPNG